MLGEQLVLLISMLDEGEMDRCQDLIHFDLGHIVIVREAGQSNSETAIMTWLISIDVYVIYCTLCMLQYNIL